MLAATGDLGPRAGISVFFLLSMLLTNFISNQATAAFLVPLAFPGAGTLDVSVRALLIAITSAASLSFMTPVAIRRTR